MKSLNYYNSQHESKSRIEKSDTNLLSSGNEGIDGSSNNYATFLVQDIFQQILRPDPRI